MASAKGRNKYFVDGDAAVILRDIDDGAETATAAETALDLGALNTADWDNGEIPWSDRDGATVVVQVSALDSTTGDETYLVTVEVADDDFTTNVTEVGRLTVTAVGVYSIRLDPDVVKAVANAPAYIRIKATLAGTTPSITYGAWFN